ncbi:MAG TPA: hypothetical protein VL173_00570 [Vicinamibacterales bacterium]|jgi:hypothetical protein|nr:hypothetical protein [Vicinamibacterales bacterium]
MRGHVISAAAALIVIVALSAYLAAAQHRGDAPTGDYTPRRLPAWHLTGRDAEQRRSAMLLRAAVRPDPADIAALPWRLAPLPDMPTITCRFLNDLPTGTTAKFNCVLDGGAVLKVKYGRNPEIQGEVAGTRLLRLFGFAADDVQIVPRLRCYGCPREPFVALVASTWTSTRQFLGPSGFDRGYTDFDWVAIERKFPAPAIETDLNEGWAWWELTSASAHRADLDALRLLAVFLAHWDNKAENQRLVCMDAALGEPSRDCLEPLAMIQDLGATFGPTKVNLGRWPTLPIWSDRTRCMVTMRALPWGGGTFPDAAITEAGRRQVADSLRRITDLQLRDLFRAARFPEFQSATDDARDLRAWVAAFHERARQIIEGGSCPQ